MSKEKRLYALSGDPITNGHIDIIQRTAKSCKLTVGLGVNPDKIGKTTFSLQERVKLIQEAIADELGVKVTYFTGLLVDYAYEEGFDTIIRGIRGFSDIQGEMDLNNVGASQFDDAPNTIFIPASQDKSHISSSTAKALLKEQGILHKYVPLNVKQALETRVLGQYIIGVTGSIGTGKSYVVNELVRIGQYLGLEIHNIDLDIIGHDILSRLNNPGYKKVRKKLVKEFGKYIKLADGFINRKELAKIVFNDPEKMKRLNEIMRTAMLVRIRREMKSKKGILLFNGALIAEFGLSVFANNNVIVVDCDKDVQFQRLKSRDKLSDVEIQKRLISQCTGEEKNMKLNEAISQYKWGKVINYKNNGEASESIEGLLRKVISHIDIYGELRLNMMLSKLKGNFDKKDLFNKIKSYYDQDNRFYHNIFHIVACLNILDKYFYDTKGYEQLFFAIVFHDIIYDMKGNNEARSAEYAEKIMKEFGYDNEFIESVKRLILITQHKEEPQTEIERIMIDIDLSILGSNEKEYRKYSEAVRHEYIQYSDDEYYKGRKRFLENLKKKKKIFYTDTFQNKFEAQARINIEWELKRIKKKYGI